MAMGMSLKTKYAVGTVIVAEDGSGDFIDIESAIDSLPNTGGVVYIKEGTYSISSGITITKSNVSILGAGSSTIINLQMVSQLKIYILFLPLHKEQKE